MTINKTALDQISQSSTTPLMPNEIEGIHKIDQIARQFELDQLENRPADRHTFETKITAARTELAKLFTERKTSTETITQRSFYKENGIVKFLNPSEKWPTDLPIFTFYHGGDPNSLGEGDTLLLNIGNDRYAISIVNPDRKSKDFKEITQHLEELGIKQILPGTSWVDLMVFINQPLLGTPSIESAKLKVTSFTSFSDYFTQVEQNYLESIEHSLQRMANRGIIPSSSFKERLERRMNEERIALGFHFLNSVPKNDLSKTNSRDLVETIKKLKALLEKDTSQPQARTDSLNKIAKELYDLKIDSITSKLNELDTQGHGDRRAQHIAYEEFYQINTHLYELGLEGKVSKSNLEKLNYWAPMGVLFKLEGAKDYLNDDLFQSAVILLKDAYKILSQPFFDQNKALDLKKSYEETLKLIYQTEAKAILSDWNNAKTDIDRRDAQNRLSDLKAVFFDNKMLPPPGGGVVDPDSGKIQFNTVPFNEVFDAKVLSQLSKMDPNGPWQSAEKNR